MRADDFTGSSPGRLVRNLDGNLAFIPNSLPPHLEWTNALVCAVSEAEAALGRLSGLGDKFPRPQRLVRLFLRREAELSSRIENTYAGVRTQLLFKSLPDVLGKAPDVIEVDNNFRAIEFGLKAIKHRPLSAGLIKQMYQILLRGTTCEESRPGEFRRVQAHIGSSRDIRAARFVPAPPHAITDCMDALEAYMAEDTTVPRVARLALIYYQFEAIHPFEDGNGRIGRVLILLLMSGFGMLPLPLFNPSAYLEQNRRAYYDHLLDVSQRGEWAGWIEFLSRGIVDECARTSRRITALQALRLDYQERLNTSRASVKLAKLVDELFARPRVRLDDVMTMLRLGSSSAQRYVAKLVDLQVLKEVTGGARNRVYLAHEIVDLFAKSL